MLIATCSSYAPSYSTVLAGRDRAVLAPVVLVFGTLMSASVGFLMIVMELRGVSSGTLPIVIGMSAVATSTLLLTVWMLSRLR